jgi:hypothetical protein
MGGKKDEEKKGDPPKNERSGPDRILDELTGPSKPDPKTNTKSEDEDGPVFIRFKTVARFNAGQFENLPTLQDLKDEMTKGEKVEPHALVSHLVASSQVELREGTEAVYAFKRSDPTQEYISMPPIETFEDPEQWASTLLHETFHMTGGKNREERIPFDRKETKEEYAREEIRAQMFMVAASAALGIPIKLDQEADYVQTFGERGNLDYKNLYKEFKASSKIFTEVLVPYLAGEQPTVPWFPDKNTWPELSEEAKTEAVKATARVLAPSALSSPCPAGDDIKTITAPEIPVPDKQENQQAPKTEKEEKESVNLDEPPKKSM